MARDSPWIDIPDLFIRGLEIFDLLVRLGYIPVQPFEEFQLDGCLQVFQLCTSRP